VQEDRKKGVSGMNTGDAITGAGLTGNEAIADQVNQALQSNATTARYPIDVAATGATVTLSGNVGNQDVKREAEQAARSVPGVVDVTNELTVGNDGSGGGGLFGLGRDRDDDTGTGDRAGGATGAIVAPLAAGGSSGGGGGFGLGAPLAAGTGVFDQSAGNEASGETNRSRNADSEEEGLS